MQTIRDTVSDFREAQRDFEECMKDAAEQPPQRREEFFSRAQDLVEEMQEHLETLTVTERAVHDPNLRGMCSRNIESLTPYARKSRTTLEAQRASTKQQMLTGGPRAGGAQDSTLQGNTGRMEAARARLQDARGDLERANDQMEENNDTLYEHGQMIDGIGMKVEDVEGTLESGRALVTEMYRRHRNTCLFGLVILVILVLGVAAFLIVHFTGDSNADEDPVEA